MPLKSFGDIPWVQARRTPTGEARAWLRQATETINLIESQGVIDASTGAVPVPISTEQPGATPVAMMADPAGAQPVAMPQEQSGAEPI